MAGAKKGRSARHARSLEATSFGSRTDIGCVREQNEDSLVVKSPLFVVADGMGGHAAGEIASEIAVSTIAELAPEHADAEALGAAVEEANRAIINAALAGEGREGMGTTCTAAMLEGERLVIAQVGDSRAYLLHAGQLVQLTRDHSLMANMIEAGQITPEEARVHPNRSVITRALGSDPSTIPDLYEINVEAGDRLLVCSDGLTGMLEDAAIEAIMNRAADPQLCASQLVNAAIAAGGMDNVTVIVVNVQGNVDASRRSAKRRSWATILFVFVLLAAIVCGAAWGGYTYLNHTAYLANVDGKVAVYRGVPGEVFGFGYSQLVEQTEIDVSDLAPSAADRIDENMRVDSVEDALALIESYRADLAGEPFVNPESSADAQAASEAAESSAAAAASSGASGMGQEAADAASSGASSASAGGNRA